MSALDGIPHLTDKQLVDTWGWMQSTVPAESPVAKAFTAELTRRKLTSPSKPIDFDKLKVVDLTKTWRK